MCKAPVIGTFVDYHSVLHIVACVAYDSNNRIRTAWTQIEIVLKVLRCSNKRRLGKQQPVNFVVHAVRVAMIRCSHCLFCHLTLIHISWTLVVVAEWDCGRYDRKNVKAVKFLMCRVWPNILFKCCYRESNLLQWTNPFDSTND